MASQLLGIKTRFTNDLGSPLVGGQVYTYFAGTSTNQDSYSDAALTVPNTNPVILDDTGSADIFLKGSYCIRVFDASGRFIEEQDNVTQAASQGDATEINERIGAVQGDIEKVKLDTGITATTKFGGITRTQAEVNANRVHVKDFGVVGDGIADDTSALVKAIAAGVALDFGDLVIRHTGIDLSVEAINWASKGVKFIYDGVYQKTAFNLAVSKHSVMAGSYEFDANKKCHVSANIYTDAPLTNRPNLIINRLRSSNAYRQSTTFTGGDGIYISGGFNILDADEITVDNCKMAAGSEVFAAQGIFGFTTAARNNKLIKHINIRTVRVSNVWSELATYKYDQDGVRIFQDLTDKESTCNIGTYYCTNVSNRALKFHSCLNAKVGKIYRVLDGNVVPQQGDMPNIDIDAQQAGMVIGSLEFSYTNTYHNLIMQSYHDIAYAETSVTNIGEVKGSFTGIIDASPVILTLQPAADNSDYRASISNVNIIGATLNCVVSVNLRTGSTAVVNVSNVTASLSDSVLRLLGSSTANLYGTVSGVSNTSGSAIPILSKYASTFQVQDVGCFGIKDTTIKKNTSGVGIGGTAKTTLDIYAQGVGAQVVRLNGSTTLSALDSNYTGWYEWYHQVNNKQMGLIGFVDTTSDMRISNELDGSILIRILGVTKINVTKSQVTINTAKFSLPNIPTSATGLVAGDLWRDGTTLKIA